MNRSTLIKTDGTRATDERIVGNRFYPPLLLSNLAFKNDEHPLDLSCKPSLPSLSSDILNPVQCQSDKNRFQDEYWVKEINQPINLVYERESQCTDLSDQRTTNRLESVSSDDKDSYDDDCSFNRDDVTRKEEASSHSEPSTSVQHSRSALVRRNREKTLLSCQVCGKAFDRPSLLKRHIRTHTGEKPHVCDVCGKGFSTSSSLNTHRRIHSGEKPHTCPICGKRFTASSNLYYHRMTHVKEKPHKCKMCHKSFPTPGDLKSHMYVHNGSWPFQCQVCKRGFSKQTNLRNHLFLHTGNKPHKCPNCDKCFALACNLRAHIRTHNQPKPAFHSALPSTIDPVSLDDRHSNNGIMMKSQPVTSKTSPSQIKTEEKEEKLISPISLPRLADHVYFWQTIQQHLATKILLQHQHQEQFDPFHFIPTSSIMNQAIPK